MVVIAESSKKPSQSQCLLYRKACIENSQCHSRHDSCCEMRSDKIVYYFAFLRRFLCIPGIATSAFGHCSVSHNSCVCSALMQPHLYPPKGCGEPYYALFAGSYAAIKTLCISSKAACAWLSAKAFFKAF